MLNSNLVLGFGLFLSTLSAHAADDSAFDWAADASDVESDAAKIKALVKKARADQSAMVFFLQRFGIEQVREQNFTIDGEIKGTVNGKVKGLTLGNMPALMAGILGAPGGIAHAMNPFSPLGAGEGMTNILRGISGLGGIKGDISGTILGYVRGAGYQINNEPHSYLVTGVNRGAIAKLDDMLATAQNRGFKVTPEVTQFLSVFSNPRMPTQAQIDEFVSIRDDFRAQLLEIDKLADEHLGEGGIFTEARTIADGFKKWGVDKRVTFVVASKDLSGYFEYAEHRCQDTAKISRFKCDMKGIKKCLWVPTWMREDSFSFQMPAIWNYKTYEGRQQTATCSDNKGTAFKIELFKLFRVESTEIQIKSANAGDLLQALLSESGLKKTENVRLYF